MIDIVQRLGLTEAQVIEAVVAAYPGEAAKLILQSGQNPMPQPPTENPPASSEDPHPMTWKGMPVRDMLAVPTCVAAKLLSISTNTLRKEVVLGRIQRTPLGTFPREELLRYLREGASDGKRRSKRL